MSRESAAKVRWWSTRVALPVLALGALAIALGRTRFDRASLVPFFDPAAQTFPLRGDWFFENVLHFGGKHVVLVCASLLLIAAVYWWRDPQRGANARRFAYLVACVLVTSALAGLWKDLAEQVTPWNTVGFGGTKPWPGSLGHASFFDSIGSPGAHAASGFAWVSLYFVGASLGTRYRWLWLGPGLGLGLLFALGQHARGAHQPSHEPWSVAIAWVVACGLAALFRAIGWLAWREVDARAASRGHALLPETALPWLIGSSALLGAVAFFATDLFTEQIESSFDGIHFRFEVVELTVTALGLGIGAWLLTDKISTMRTREARRIEEERERRFQVLGRMAASVAHEVRNPLQTLRLIVDEQRAEVAGLREHALVPEFEGCLDRIDRAVDLVYRLARPESGESECADMAQATRDSVVALSRISMGRIAFAWERDPPPAPVVSSGAALRIVIDNLLRNAAEASPDGESVSLELKESDAKWALRIRNRGSLRTRRDNPSRADGLGLGVPISRQIAENAGGSIELAEADGVVTCTLSWPRAGEETA